MQKNAKPAMPVEAMAFVVGLIVVAAALFQYVVISPDRPEMALLRTLIACGAATVIRWPFQRA